MNLVNRLTARRLARRLDDIRLIAFWRAVGADVRAEKAATERISAAATAAHNARSTT